MEAKAAAAEKLAAEAAAAVHAAAQHAATDSSAGAKDAAAREPEHAPPAAPSSAPVPLVTLPELPAEALPPLPGAEGLVQATLAQAVRAGEEWATVYRAMLTQSAADVAIFSAEAAAREAAFREERERLARDAAAAVVAAEKAAATAQAAAQAAEAQLRQSRREQQEKLHAHAEALLNAGRESLRGAMQATIDASTAALAAEDEERGATVAALATGVDALAAAFVDGGVQRERAGAAHALALATLAWEGPLRRGRPFARELARVAAEAVDEPLLGEAADSVGDLATRGVATRAALAAQLPPLVSAVRRLALLPAGEAPTAPRYAAAALAAALRFREPAGESARERAWLRPGDAGGGIEGALARVAHAAAHSRLAAAADELEAATANTAAAAAVAPWVEAARDRARAEAALEVVRAHCTRLAVALSAPDERQ